MKTKEENSQFLRKEVRDIFTKLSPKYQPKWGKMDAQQMLEHLGMAVKVSNGKIDVELATPLDKVEKLKRISLMSDRPLPLDFKNPILPDEPISHFYQGFGQARGALWNELDLFFDYFSKQDKNHTRMHNIFGELNDEEWLWFHYKHFMHHAMQFGLVEKFERL